MRILLLPLGSLGDVNPFIGLGLALQKRGHEVVVVTNAGFESKIKQAGLAVSSCDPAQTSPDILRHLGARRAEESASLFCRLCLAAIPEAFSKIRQLYQPGNTVVAAQPHVFAARIAQERLGVPLATVTLSPVQLYSAYVPGSGFNRFGSWLSRLRRRLRRRRIDMLLAPEINSFRAKLGLKPVRRALNLWRNSPQRVIGLWPEWLYAPQPHWPSNAVVTGFIEYDGPPAAGSLDPSAGALREGGGGLPIVITAGTTNLDKREFFAAACGACEILNWPGLLQTHQKELLPQPLPRMVRLIPYTPFGQLLPRAAAIVHHGGIGTAARALKAGIPQILMPLAYDQFDNTQRLVRLGVASSIQRERTPRNVAARLRELLQSQTVLEHCRSYAMKFQNDSALESTCDYIEALR